ncbi:MAG: DUF1800 family protein [Massilia sp.]
MLDIHDDCLVGNDDAKSETVATDASPLATPALALLSGTLLAACGGGSSGSSDTPPPPPPPPPTPPTAAEASRFLAQASMGSTRDQMARVISLGYSGWLDEQFALPASGTHWDWLVAGGYNAAANVNSEAGIDASLWRKLLSSPDTLRQRVTLALSEIVVAAVTGFVGSGWKSFSAAAFLDLLEANAFGNYRTLLQKVSLSAPMGEFLTYRGNVKFNPTTGAMPDENYAREVMQLFTIGLLQLNLDGTPKLTNGNPVETYTLDDITGLARVFTGWNYDLTGTTTATPDFKGRPMTQTASRHESGTKVFLGTTIPAGTDGLTSLTMALDTIFAHANVGPFISRQLIQRLVCSNPSPAYVSRVATVFNNDGTGVKGNLKAVVKAILLDTEARSAAGLTDPNFGKQREPIMRLAAWARAFKATSPSDLWPIGNTSDPGTRLGQSPLRSATVFNFFRPGYVPPNSAIGTAGLVAPEFQITNESTVVGYLNYMQNLISRGTGDFKADYTALLPLADTAQSLIDEINVVLAAGQLSAATVTLIKGALDSMASGTDTARLNRIYAALVMVMAAPEFIVQK